MLNTGINNHVHFDVALITGFFLLSLFYVVDEGNVDVLFSTKDLGFSDAFIQRIRISPDQRYMAISLKSENSEEATCVIMKLDHSPVIEKVIQSVFSFGKLFINVLWIIPAFNTTFLLVYK